MRHVRLETAEVRLGSGFEGIGTFSSLLQKVQGLGLRAFVPGFFGFFRTQTLLNLIGTLTASSSFCPTEPLTAASSLYPCRTPQTPIQHAPRTVGQDEYTTTSCTLYHAKGKKCWHWSSSDIPMAVSRNPRTFNPKH